MNAAMEKEQIHTELKSKCIAQTSKYEVVCVGKLTVRQLGRSDCEANVFPQ